MSSSFFGGAAAPPAPRGGGSSSAFGPSSFLSSTVPTAPSPSTLFGSSTTTAPAPSTSTAGPPTGFSFHSTATPAPQQQPQQQPSALPPTLKVPEYSTLFRGEQWRAVQATALRLLRQDTAPTTTSHNTSSRDNYAIDDATVDELVALLRAVTEHDGPQQPQSWSWLSPPAPVPPNPTLRQQLALHPEVELVQSSEDDSNNNTPSRRTTVVARLTQPMYTTILQLADQLHISEEMAVCLFAKASSSMESSSESSTPSIAERIQVAQQLWFQEQSVPLEALLLLCQYRLQSSSIVQATDICWLQHGGISHILQAIRDYTIRIQQWWSVLHQQQQYRSTNEGTEFSAPNLTTIPKAQYQLAQQQRHMLCHAVFFLAYHTQWEPNEVAILLDVVRDLSHDLKVLDPCTDVPSPYSVDEAQHHHPYGVTSSYGRTTTTTPWSSPQPGGGMAQFPTPEKDFLTWQTELIHQTQATGLIELLQCVSTLVVTVMCTLEASIELYDRRTHQIQGFGTGNALLPPDTQSTHSLEPIHSRLTKDVAQQWSRSDICGILMASYALLLRSSPATLASPRGSGSVAMMGGGGGGSSSSSSSSMDVRKAWRECLEAPRDFKSFTFGRLALVPALLGTASIVKNIASQDPKKVCDTTEFLLSALSRTVSTYLHAVTASGDVPVSRKKWEQDAEENLRLRRSQQEEQRQFQAWSRTRESHPMEAVPTSVDLLQRPDCMDDVIAFAVAVCSLGPECAQYFWSPNEGIESGSDSPLDAFPTLATLDQLQEDDESLLASYVSFLAALAVADGGAEMVHRILACPPEEGRKGQVTWTTVVQILHWYTRELSTSDYGATATLKTASAMSTSTSYYYADEDSKDDFDWGASSTSGFPGSGSSTTTKSLDLGESSSFVLMSHLNLISAVCEHCLSARVTVLSTSLPIQGAGLAGGREVVGHDSTLFILFSLAVSPLSPDARGAVFIALSHLLMANKSDVAFSKVQESALTAWQLLDQCQIVPIYLLDQYPTIFDSDPKNSVGLAFPPSSISQVTEKSSRTWIPPKPFYSIVYELEYVESSKGVYASTEGFLRLLRSLFVIAGSPSDLGRSWRARPGCTPYIEYVKSFVLARTMGTFPDCASLPFRTLQDRSRLIALALGVLEVTVTTYLPMSDLTLNALGQKEVKFHHRQLAKHALAKMNLPSLVDQIVQDPSVEDANLFLDDWRATLPKDAKFSQDSRMDTPLLLPSTDRNPLMPAQRSVALSVPATKSPAFSVLVDLLNASGGQLFHSLVKIILTSNGTGVKSLDADTFSLTYAMFLAAPPSLLSAKAGVRKTQTMPFHILLATLQEDRERLRCTKTDNWMELAILRALNILCAAAVREDQLLTAIDATSGSVNIVPVLSFRKRINNAARLEASSGKLSKLSKLLLASNVDSGILCRIANLLGSEAMSELLDAGIAQASSALVFYVDMNLDQGDAAARFYQVVNTGEFNVAQAFGSRLIISSCRLYAADQVEVISFVVNQILMNLRALPLHCGIGEILLGVPNGTSLKAQRKVTHNSNCFEALLHILGDQIFMTSHSMAMLSSKAFEIIARLLTYKSTFPRGLESLRYTVERLQAVDFWRHHLSKLTHSLTSVREVDAHLHSMAWLLKSVAYGMDFLQGSQLGMPMPLELDRLMTVLYEAPQEVMGTIIRSLPITRLQVASTGNRPTEEALRNSKVNMVGAPEVMEGYEIIDVERLLEFSSINEDGAELSDLKNWCDAWNSAISRDCSMAHCSSAICLVIGTTVAADHGRLLSRRPSVYIGWSNLLHQLLTSMSVRNLDSKLFSTSTHNLSLAALTVASNRIVSPEAVIDDTSVRSLAAEAVVCSGIASTAFSYSTTKYERTAILGSVFALLLTETSASDIANDIMSYDDAVTILLDVACCNLDTGTPSVVPKHVLLARSCINNIFDKLNEVAPAICHLFIHRTLFRPHNGDPSISKLIGLVARLDWNVALTLQKICAIPSGPEILLESNVLEALLAASAFYNSQESKKWSKRPSVYKVVDVGIPPFLPSHLYLLVSLLASTYLESRRDSMLIECTRILNNYKWVWERLVTNVSANFELLQLVVRCFCAIKALSNNPNQLTNHADSAFSPIKIGSDDLARGFATVALQFVIHPLPSEFLPSLQDVMASQSPLQRLLLSLGGKSWWDSVTGVDATSQAGVLAVAAGAADVAKNCFWIYREQVVSTTDDLLWVVLGLCRCSDALDVLYLSTSTQNRGADADADTLSGKRRLLSLLADVVVELLGILLHHTRSFNSTAGGSDLTVDLKKTIRLALDLCRLDVPGGPSPHMHSVFADENRPNYISELVQALRRELLYPLKRY